VKKAILISLILLFPGIALAQTQERKSETRLNLAVDFNHKTLGVYGREATFTWEGIEVTLEHGFRKDKLLISGFVLGFRREGEIRYDGTYFMAGVFKRFDLKDNKLILYPEIRVLYGVPGTHFNRTWVESTGLETVRYAKLYPVRNADVPFIYVKRFGWYYPEILLTMRTNMWRFNFDVVAGARIMRFGAVESDFQEVNSKILTTIVPIIKIRTGIRF